MTKPVTISYVRFSSAPQERGDSVRRQTKLRDDYLARHPDPPLDDSLTLADLGVSAFTGKNAMCGNLRKFLDAVRAGRVAHGSRLLVESLDRISRQGIDEGYDLCKLILKAGVRIVTLSPEREFGPEAVRGLTKGALELQLILERAAEESETRSRRVHAAWAEKRRRCRAGVPQEPTERMGHNAQFLTRQLPRWIRERDGKLELIPEKAAAVRLLFQLAAAGYGTQRMAGKLMRDGVPPINGRPWTKPYIAKILRNPACIGEYQPRGPGRKPDGSAVRDYYPAVVTPEEWAAARAGAAARKHDRSASRKQGEGLPVNVFGRLVYDAIDRGSWFMTARCHTGRKYYVLQNSASAEGREPCRSLPYPPLEKAVLSCLREVNPADVTGEGTDAGPNDVAVLEGQLAELQAKTARLQAKLDAEVLAGDPDGLAREYKRGLSALESEARELSGGLDMARADAAHPLQDSWAEAHSLTGLLHSAIDPEDVRLRLRTALRRVVNRITLFVPPQISRERFAFLQVDFHKGTARRYYVFYSRPPLGGAAGGAPGRWCAMSWVDANANEPDLNTTEGQEAALRLLDTDILPAVLRGEVQMKGDLAVYEGEIPRASKGPSKPPAAGQ
jgi:DNA invertase Pin-like site-specific DNA recombinase